MTIILIDEAPILRLGLSEVYKRSYSNANILEYRTLLELGHIELYHDVVQVVLGVTESTNESSLHLLRKVVGKVPIIVCDKVFNRKNALLYLHWGAAAYITQGDSIEFYIECANKTMSGKRFIDERLIDLLIDQNVVKSNFKTKIGKKLTQYEIKVIGCLLRGYKTKEIAVHLNNKPSTISTTKGKIFRKLNITNILELKEIAKDLKVEIT